MTNKKTLTRSEMQIALMDYIDKHFGGVKLAAAQKWNVSAQSLGDMTLGNTHVSENIAEKVGYKIERKIIHLYHKKRN